LGVTGLPCLISTDGYQVTDAHSGYPCRQGLAEYTAPEFQGASAGTARSREQDHFALAVLIFQLLMQGAHPFAGRCITGTPTALGERIAAGHWPYCSGWPVPYAPEPRVAPLTVLPPRIQVLLRRCFEDGHLAAAHRPDAAT